MTRLILTMVSAVFSLHVVAEPYMKQQLQNEGVRSFLAMSEMSQLPPPDSVAGGVEEPLSADLDDTDLAEIDAMLDGYDDDHPGEADYVVVASFRGMQNADEFAMSASVSGYEVIVRSATVNGVDYYRVLVGPVSESDEDDIKRRLAEQGHHGTWVLRGVSSSSYLFDLDDEPVIRRQPIQPGSRLTEPRAYPGEESDYNLARLKNS